MLLVMGLAKAADIAADWVVVVKLLLGARHRKSSATVRLSPSTSRSSLPDPGVGGGVGAIANFAARSGDVWLT